MIGPAWPAGIGRRQRPSGSSRGSRRAIAPGMPSTSAANRWSCCWTRSRMNGSWFFASFASVKQNSSSPRSTNSRGVHANTSIPSSRPPVSGIRVAATPARGRPEADAGERRRLDADRGPALGRALRLCEQPVGLVEPQQILALDVEDQHSQVRGRLADDRGEAVSTRRKNSANDVLVATPEMPRDRHVAALAPVEEVEIDVHGQRRRGRGRPAAAAPSGRRRARGGVPRRSARSTVSPGSAETHTSGSTRVTATRAVRTFCAGMMPSSAIRWVSDSYCAPS